MSQKYGRRHRVAEQEGAEGAALEPQDHGGGVLDVEPAHRRGRDRLDALDLPAEEAEAVEVVDRVDQQRAASGTAAPVGLEVRLVLAHEAEAVDGDDLAEVAAQDRPPRLLHVGAVPPVVAHEHRDAAHVGGLDERQRGGDRVGDRLLDEHGNPTFDARKTRLEVQRVRQGDDRAVGPDLVEHAVVVDEERCPVLGCESLGLGRHVRDRDEARVGVAGDQPDVLATDPARAHEGDAHLRHVPSPPRSENQTLGARGDPLVVARASASR